MSTQSQMLDALLDVLADKVADRLASRLPTSAADKKLLSIKDAALYLSRSQSTIRSMIDTREIPAPVVRRFGKRVFLVKDEVDRWLKSC